ncbi:uncharacterized protein [Ptychodera flava]|uniref:uncharacterized protein n=1 Tax=Ptychodera flava TaxID=63121 RepID=UPI00396A29DA
MPLDTVLCLDTSGSMAGRGLRELKKAVDSFLHGVEVTARECSLKENVAVVEFGKNERIVQPLTNQYDKVKRAAAGLQAGGRTPMFAGLMKAMEEILQNGGVLQISGRRITPRVILMTDGIPTDENGESDEAKIQVLKAAAAFGPGYKEVGLPHPIPIACVGCGECDPELLGAIAKLTNGMFVVVDNVEELSTFFKRQVLLIRFAAKFADDMENLCSLLVMREFMKALGEAVEEAEAQAMMGMLMGMMGMGNRELEGLPPLGSRIRRGKDWKWKDQDKNGVGTVIEHDKEGWVHVEWDHGDDNKYRWGAEGKRDLKTVDEPRILKPGEDIKVGVRVQRGKDWKWDNQDGGPSNIGFVYRVHTGAKKGLVQVRWPSGVKADYRFGYEGSYDLRVIGSGATPSIVSTATPKLVEIDDSGSIPKSTVAKAPPTLLAIESGRKTPAGAVQVLPPPPTLPKFTEKLKAQKNREILEKDIGAAPAAVSSGKEKVTCWKWKDDSEQWRLLDDQVCQQLEASYRQNPAGCVSVTIGKYGYNFDFTKMKQVNQQTRRERDIRREDVERDEYDLLLELEKMLL